MTRRTALAVSPHLDDAVFSAGGTLARFADADWRVVVATVFTRSVPNPGRFALACQLDKGLPPTVDYMALRRDEDVLACQLIGAEPRWLDFAEAPHRGYDDAPALFGVVGAEDAIAPALRTSIFALLDELSPSAVLAPQSIGGHVDHVLVTEALRSVELRDGPVLWWRDFPYVSRTATPKTPFAASFDHLREFGVPIDGERKRRACEAYRSQIGFQFGGAAGLAERLARSGPVERFAAEPGAIEAGATEAGPLLRSVIAGEHAA